MGEGGQPEKLVVPEIRTEPRPRGDSVKTKARTKEQDERVLKRCNYVLDDL